MGVQVRWAIDKKSADDPHAKASLLLQAHLGRTPLPISDYFTDTRSVLDNSLRILQVPLPAPRQGKPPDSALLCVRFPPPASAAAVLHALVSSIAGHACRGDSFLHPECTHTQ